MHEQSAVHLADGVLSGSPASPWRPSPRLDRGRRTPSSASPPPTRTRRHRALTGSAHTYMRGHTVLQEIDRAHDANNARIFEPIVKRWWQPSSVEVVPLRHSSAPSPRCSPAARTGAAGPADGRPGRRRRVWRCPTPANAAEPPDDARRGAGRTGGGAVGTAQRPAISRGAASSPPTRRRCWSPIAEHIGAAVVTTWMGKGDPGGPRAERLEHRRHGEASAATRLAADRRRRCSRSAAASPTGRRHPIGPASPSAFRRAS